MLDRDHLQEASWHLVSKVVDIASNVDSRVLDRLFFLDRHRLWLQGSLLFESFQLVLEQGKLFESAAVVGGWRFGGGGCLVGESFGEELNGVDDDHVLGAGVGDDDFGSCVGEESVTSE